MGVSGDAPGAAASRCSCCSRKRWSDWMRRRSEASFDTFASASAVPPPRCAWP